MVFRHCVRNPPLRLVAPGLLPCPRHAGPPLPSAFEVVSAMRSWTKVWGGQWPRPSGLVFPGWGLPLRGLLFLGMFGGRGARSSLFSRAGERPFLDIFDKCPCGQISMTSSWTLSADWFPDLKSPPTSRPLRAVRTVWHGGSSSWWKFWGKDPFLATLQVHFVGVCSDQRLATSRIPLLMFPPALTQ